MTTPTPIPVPPRIEEMRVPKKVYVLFTLVIALGLAGATAGILNAYVTYDSGVAEQEDVLENRRILNSTCENTRIITEQFASTPPTPCPTADP